VISDQIILDVASIGWGVYVGLIPLREIDFDKERIIKRDLFMEGCTTGFCYT
jgi:hypothetical protein